MLSRGPRLFLNWLLVALGLTVERLYRLRYLHRGSHRFASWQVLRRSIKNGKRARVIRCAALWAAEQITYRKQSETKNSTPEIKIVPGAVLEPPMHHENT